MFLAWQTLIGGKLTYTINAQTLAKGEEAIITLTARGKEVAFPNLKEIEGYPVTSTGVSQSFSASFGGGSSAIEQTRSIRYSFFPEHNVTVPPLKVTIDGTVEQTRPTPIHVTATSPAFSGEGGYRLQTVTTRHSVYVGEPFLLQVIFTEPRNSNIAQAKYEPPTFDGFFVKAPPRERLVDTPEATQHIFDYILTPQKEGNLTITAPQIKLGIQTFTGARDPWGFFNNEVQWRSLRGAARTVTVKPLPSPADLVGDFQLKAAIDSHNIEANKPLNYTLTVEGEGSLDEMEDPKYDLPGVTVYSDDAQVDTRIEHGQIISRWVKKYTFIADRDFTLPSHQWTVFNPKTGQISTLRTSSAAIKVQGSGAAPAKPVSPPTQRSALPDVPPPAASPLSPSPRSPSASSPHTDANQSLFEDKAFYARQAAAKQASLYGIAWVIGAFVAGIVATLLAQLLWKKMPKNTRKKPHKKYTVDEALDLLYPHTNDSPEIEEAVRDLYRNKNGENLPIDQAKIARLIASVAPQS